MMTLSSGACAVSRSLLALPILFALCAATSSTTLTDKHLTAALERGGYVILMRHASSPRTPPTPVQADPDNLHHERQLDDAGRASARAMGDALHRLRIPIGQVLSSPTYRALETARLVHLGPAETSVELGDAGRSMAAAPSSTRGAWLRRKVTQAPAAGTDTLIITHAPNIQEAFPSEGADLADGEALIFRPDGRGSAALVAHVKIEDWPRLADAASASLADAASASLNHPTGTLGLVMVDKMGSRVLFFGPSGDRELGELRPSADPALRPHEVAISPDARTAYVSVYGDGVFGNNPHPGHTIAIIDLRTRRMVGSIDVSPYRAPHGMQVDAAGRLYVACDLDHKVLVIDQATGHIEAAIDAGEAGHWIALAPEVGRIYVSAHGTEPFISVIDLNSRRVIDRIPIEHGTMGVTVSPDGRTVLAADAAEPILHVISTRTDRELGQVRVQDYDRGLYKVFYSPDGRYVLTCLPNGQINIFNAADLQAAQRIVHSPGTALMGFAFSADGRSAITGNHGQGTASRIDLTTARITDTFAAGKGVETLAYY